MWVYRVSHCPTFSVNSLWIIGVCYRGVLVSVGQSHDISLWSILSLGNRSINVEMIYKLWVFEFDINWYLITLIIYVQTLKWLQGELTRGYKQRVLMHRHQGWNVRHGLCHIYMRYLYIWVVYSFCLFCCLFIIVTWWYIWCIVSQVASKRKYRHVW